MSSAHSKIGMRVTIVDVFHSPARSRAFRDQLCRRQGVIVAVLRLGTLALVELADEEWHRPAGVRRWPLCWDDLVLEGEASPSGQPAVTYTAGFAGEGRQMVQHVVPPGEVIGLCGQAVHPLPILGWSLTFSSTGRRACPACVALEKDPDQDDDARILLAS